MMTALQGFADRRLSVVVIAVTSRSYHGANVTDSRESPLTAGRGRRILPNSYGTSRLWKPFARALDATFIALADPTRRAILARLVDGEASVMELAAPFAMSQPAISKHLKMLERAGLISRGRDAQRRPCRLEAKPLAQATQWLERYRKLWAGNFQRLDALLDEMQTDPKPRGRAKRRMS